MLYLSVVGDEGWTVQVNGEKTEPILVQAGENHIQLQDHIPGLPCGLAVSLFCGALLITLFWKGDLS